jgi:hypothetical protein
MSETRAFTHVCEALEGLTHWDRLQARGTVRLALKQAGLDAARVTPGEMSVVVGKILPAELAARGIAAPEPLCNQLLASLAKFPRDAAVETPESVFGRLGNVRD